MVQAELRVGSKRFPLVEPAAALALAVHERLVANDDKQGWLDIPFPEHFHLAEKEMRELLMELDGFKPGVAGQAGQALRIVEEAGDVGAYLSFIVLKAHPQFLREHLA